MFSFSYICNMRFILVEYDSFLNVSLTLLFYYHYFLYFLISLLSYMFNSFDFDFHEVNVEHVNFIQFELILFL